MQKRIFIKTLGCQMNEYDSNRIYDSVKRLAFDSEFAVCNPNEFLEYSKVKKTHFRKKS